MIQKFIQWLKSLFISKTITLKPGEIIKVKGGEVFTVKTIARKKLNLFQKVEVYDLIRKTAGGNHG